MKNILIVIIFMPFFLTPLIGYKTFSVKIHNHFTSTRKARSSQNTVSVSKEPNENFDLFFKNTFFLIDKWNKLEKGMAFDTSGQEGIKLLEIKRIKNKVVINIVGEKAEKLYKKIMGFSRQKLENLLEKSNIKLIISSSVTTKDENLMKLFSILNLSQKELEVFTKDVEQKGDRTGFTQYTEDLKNSLSFIKKYLELEINLMGYETTKGEIVNSVLSGKSQLIKKLEEINHRYKIALSKTKKENELIEVNSILRPRIDIEIERQLIQKFISHLESNLGTLIYRTFYRNYIEPNLIYTGEEVRYLNKFKNGN